MEGDARAIVVAVGAQSVWGALQMSLRETIKESDDGKKKHWPFTRRWLVKERKKNFFLYFFI